MTEFIGELFSKIFNGNVVLATVLVSMLPIMELKGGIPFGMSVAFWGDKALKRWSAFGWAFLGCFIVTIIVYFIFTPLMKWFRKTKIFKGLANYIDNKTGKQKEKIEMAENGEVDEKKLRRIRFAKIMAVLVFVAIPLPLTGVWMGTCLAVVLKLNFAETMFAVNVGNVIAGIIISTICVIFPQFTHILIYVFMGLVVLLIIAKLIIDKINKNKIKNN